MFYTRYTRLLKKSIPLCCAFLLISLVVVCQQPYQFKALGWRASTQKGDEYHIKTNKKDTSILEYGSITSLQKKDWQSSLYNVFLSDSAISQGAIIVEGQFRTDHLTDENEAGIAIQAGPDDQSPNIYSNLAQFRIKKGDTANNIQLVIPFETPVKTVRCFLYINGAGTVRVNDLRVTVTGGEFDDRWKAIYVDRPTKDNNLRNKVALYIRVWGFLKYYVPAISEKRIDWDAVFVKYIPFLFTFGSQSGIEKQISNLITASQAPVATGSFNLDGYSKEQLINFDNSWLRMSTLAGRSNQKRLLEIEKGFKEFSNYYVQVIDSSTAPNPKFQHEETYSAYRSPDVRYRLLMLARYWNIIQYYYPYKYTIDANWHQVLEKNIAVFTAATTRDAYLRAVLLLSAEINDGHAAISPGIDKIALWTAIYGTQNIVAAPLLFEIASSGQVVIAGVDTGFSRNTGIKAGDIMLAVNNSDMRDRVSAIEKYIGAGRREMKYHYISTMNLLAGMCPKNDSLLFKYKSADGKINHANVKVDADYFNKYAVFLSTNILGTAPGGGIKNSITVVNDTVLYIDISAFKQRDTAQLIQLLPSVNKAIIDLRTYPSPDAYYVIPFFAAGGTHFVDFMYPDKYPGILEKKVKGTTPPGRQSIFNGKLALLVTEGTQSNGEFLTMMLQTAKNVMLVGRTTAGADGNISYIPGIGIPPLFFSGIRITYPDNRETQRTGIKPGIIIPRSPGEISGNGDTVLHAALQYLQKQ